MSDNTIAWINGEAYRVPAGYAIVPRPIPPNMKPDDPDLPIAVACCLEREYVKSIVALVHKMPGDRTGPVAAGMTLACDEIAVRLQEAWGEEPTDAEAWKDCALAKGTPDAEGAG